MDERHDGVGRGGGWRRQQWRRSVVSLSLFLSAFHEEACLLFLIFFELLTRSLPRRARRRPLLLAPEGRLRRLLCPVLAPLLLPHSGLFQEVRARGGCVSLPPSRSCVVPCRAAIMVLVSPGGNLVISD